MARLLSGVDWADQIRDIDVSNFAGRRDEAAGPNRPRHSFRHPTPLGPRTQRQGRIHRSSRSAKTFSHRRHLSSRETRRRQSTLARPAIRPRHLPQNRPNRDRATRCPRQYAVTSVRV